MASKHIDQLIADYLQELKQALKGQDPILIQDAQYDAEEHLRAALEDENESGKAFSDICESYGSPQEIAEYYRDMEIKVNLALHGVKKSPELTGGKKFLSVLRDFQAYRVLLYMILAFPLSIGYLLWVIMFGATSISLVVVLIGVPLLVLFLQSMQIFSLFEGRLIEMLLGQRMPRRPQYKRSVTGWKAYFKSVITNGKNWSTVLYLLLQLPLATFYLLAIICPVILCLTVFFSPIIDPMLHFIDPIRYEIDINWYWFPLAMPGGVIGLALILHLALYLGRFQAWLARSLLVPKV